MTTLHTAKHFLLLIVVLLCNFTDWCWFQLCNGGAGNLWRFSAHSLLKPCEESSVQYCEELKLFVLQTKYLRTTKNLSSSYYKQNIFVLQRTWASSFLPSTAKRTCLQAANKSICRLQSKFAKKAITYFLLCFNWKERCLDKNLCMRCLWVNLKVLLPLEN